MTEENIKHKELKENLLNEILIAFLYSKNAYGEPSDELISYLAKASGKTELIIKEHFKLLMENYAKCTWDKIKPLVPHRNIQDGNI